MNYSVYVLDEFKKNLKKLFKKYKRIDKDVASVINELEKTPNLGTYLHNGCYKIRVPNSSIPTGKKWRLQSNNIVFG